MKLFKGSITDINMARGVNIRGGFVYQYRIVINKMVFKMTRLKETTLSVGEECCVIYTPGTINNVIDIFLREDYSLKKKGYSLKSNIYSFMVLSGLISSVLIFFKFKDYLAISLILVFVSLLCLRAVFEMRSFVKLLKEVDFK